MKKTSKAKDDKNSKAKALPAFMEKGKKKAPMKGKKGKAEKCD